ncbi:MAG: response regulator transcription factor [Alistipes sp.]|nr:response regulator transcription factor [Alistipes sp.]
MIRVALVDDHSLFRRGMKLLLSSHPDIEVVVEVASGEEFLDVVGHTSPDVVFMDYSMPGMNGAEATERALTMLPSLKVIALSMYGEHAYYTRMMECGAKGFLLKDSEFDEVVEAVKSVNEGGTYFSASLLESLSHSIKRTYKSQLGVAEEDRLSEREIEILVAICRGLSTQEIADELYISKRTVDKHRANILDKSGCKNTASLVVYAIKHGLVEL